MGGVYLAYMRRLHCNSTIMVLNRWWLNLFFYLLDVGASNAMVIHRESWLGITMNIVDFKKALVLNLVVNKIQRIPEIIVENQLIRMHDNQWFGCEYWSLFSKNKRTKFKCKACDVPLCSVGTGKSDCDCLSLSH